MSAALLCWERAFAATTRRVYSEAAEGLGKDLTDLEWSQRNGNDRMHQTFLADRWRWMDKTVLHYDFFS